MVKILMSFALDIDNEEGELLKQIDVLENKNIRATYWDMDGVINIKTFSPKTLMLRWDFPINLNNLIK